MCDQELRGDRQVAQGKRASEPGPGTGLLSPTRPLSARRAGTPFSKSDAGNGNLSRQLSYQRISFTRQ